jgi:hypothetical protein
MSKLQDQAIEEAHKLPEPERRWDDLFAQPSAAIERMADEALEDHRTGRTIPLDPDKL